MTDFAASVWLKQHGATVRVSYSSDPYLPAMLRRRGCTNARDLISGCPGYGNASVLVLRWILIGSYFCTGQPAAVLHRLPAYSSSVALVNHLAQNTALPSSCGRPGLDTRYRFMTIVQRTQRVNIPTPHLGHTWTGSILQQRAAWRLLRALVYVCLFICSADTFALPAYALPGHCRPGQNPTRAPPL